MLPQSSVALCLFSATSTFPSTLPVWRNFRTDWLLPSAASSCLQCLGIFGVFRFRAFTNAIDPVYGKSENLVFLPNQILRNTTEQFFLHMMAMLTLTLFLQGSSMKAIPILCGIFLIARIVFQVGYTASPMKRAYGFASTFLPTVAVYVYCTYCLINKLLN